MDATKKIFFSSETSTLIIGLVLTLFAVVVGVFMYSFSNTLPVAREPFFGGVAVGSGIPDCVRASSEAGEILSYFQTHASTTEEGADDLRELTLILSKVCCLKKDLLSISGLVEATLYQRYSTAHDIEPVEETAARCLAKTIPKRDLDLSFDKWYSRGHVLLARLCTSYTATPGEIGELNRKFDFLMKDVREIAAGACLAGEPIIAGEKFVRGEKPYEPPSVTDLGPYKGYY
jgi:hypothetical protein